jgi:hypothetical protein
MYPPDPRKPQPAPRGPEEYYKGSMPEYERPNQDRLARDPDEHMDYWWARRHGIPQERP